MKTSHLTNILKAVMLVFGLTALPAHAAEILPHQAHYNLTVENVNMPGMSSSRGGDFFLRIEKGCNSWVMASQFSFHLESSDSVPINMVMVSQWEETIDGQSMSFQNQTIINGVTAEFFEGVANVGKDGKEGMLYLTQPEQTTHILPPNVFFPLSATKQSMENIASGQVVQNYALYDGASDKAMRVSDLRAGPAVLPDNLPDSVIPYVKEGGWKIVTSFFDFAEIDGEATSTHLADIYENGITTKLKISNPQLTAIGTMDQFEVLKLPECTNAN